MYLAFLLDTLPALPAPHILRFNKPNLLRASCGTVVDPKVQTNTRLFRIPNAFRRTEQVKQLTCHRSEDGI